MTSKIAIIGLGQIGASIGLRFRSKPGSPKVVGFDKEGSVARTAEAVGAVEAATSLKSAVRDAGIVFLCLPLSQMQDTLKQIGPELSEGAVVLDTAPVKRRMMEWVRESLPAGRYYLGLVPAVSPAFLGAPEVGIKGAHAELFERSVMMIVVPPGTPAEVEELGVNVAKLLGAKPLLADPTEADGLMISAHLLPQLMASALLEACLSETGWVEARKLAGRPFAGVTGGVAYYDDPQSLQQAALSHPSTVIHALDVVIAALKGLRDDIDRGNHEDVSERLLHGYQAREQWLDERSRAAWLTEGGEPIEVPDFGERAMQMLFGGVATGRGKLKTDKPG